MRRIVTSVLRLQDLIGEWLNWGAGIIILSLGLMTIVQVISRVTYRAPSGIIELAELMLVGTIWLAIAYTQRIRGHVRLELLIDMVHGKKRHLIESLYLIVFLIVFGIITTQSAKSALIAFQVGDFHGDILEIPVWPSKAAVTLGSLFLSLRFLRQLVEHLIALFSPKVLPSEIEKARLDYE